MNTNEKTHEPTTYGFTETVTNVLRANENARKIEEYERKIKNIKKTAGGIGVAALVYGIIQKVVYEVKIGRTERELRAIGTRITKMTIGGVKK